MIRSEIDVPESVAISVDSEGESKVLTEQHRVAPESMLESAQVPVPMPGTPAVPAVPVAAGPAVPAVVGPLLPAPVPTTSVSPAVAPPVAPTVPAVPPAAAPAAKQMQAPVKQVEPPSTTAAQPGVQEKGKSKIFLVLAIGG